MEIVQLQQQYVDFYNSLYREGFVDDQFIELKKLQDESSPDFVFEVVSLFFKDSEKLLNNLTTALQQPIVDFNQVDADVHQLRGSSSSVGAQRVMNGCVVFRSSCEEKSLEGCLMSLEQVKMEYYQVKTKLDTLFKLEQKILGAGGTVPCIKD